MTTGAPYIRQFDLPRKPDGNPKRVTDYYGANVFDFKAMSKSLSSKDADKLARVMAGQLKMDATLAERIATAVKDWSIAHGATHYCHWFQPQTGASAEKHDAFLSFDRDGHPLESFSGGQLLQAEPDASSFPSGGMRSTFEARGYTGWDPSSPMFIVETENDKTLYIPSVFISYHGEALDVKLPLLRSLNTLSTEVTNTLHLLGEKAVTHVNTTIGAEQEFFVIDRELGLQRPDLKMAGRSVFGKMPAKGQELEDHYFAHMPSRVQAFINEVEYEMYRLGVPLKTRHNEVAPGQFEIAPIFEAANVAADHNQLLMKMLRLVSSRHGLLCILHEKPFAGINGSGKHVNWSMADSTGRNLLDPGSTPQDNLVFLTTLAAVLQGISEHADVLRASIASCANDHRLGANEAPPAIMSVFLGHTLDKILTAIETGEHTRSSAEKVMIELGVGHLQEFMKDNTDRNRTSPFAFTGNKFEFRAVGSSASIGYPAAILNAAVASGFKTINAKLTAKGKKVGAEDVLAVVKEVVTATRHIRFEGNGYSDEWKKEAAKRGLSNFPNTPAALEVLSDVKKTKFLVDANILTQEDVASRMTIQVERYVKQRLIEANVAIEMAKTGILPAALRYFKFLADTGAVAKQAQLPSPTDAAARSLSELTIKLQSTLSSFEKMTTECQTSDALDHHNVLKTAHTIAKILLPQFDELRTYVDQIEAIVPSHEWPYPKYEEMLFGFE